jgi:predicted DCC family thiol-disulfide oxidoreductase YuxK
MFSFTPMQSESGKRLIEKHDTPMVGVDTFLLIKNGQCYERTDAAIEIARDLTGLWPMLRVFKILPRSFRDFFYRLIARNRYKLFGRRDDCMVPSPELRDRFLE